MSDLFDDNDDFVMDATGMTEDTLKGPGGMVNADGNYHLMVMGWSKEGGDGKVPSIRVDFEVLAGTDQTQVGKKHFHRVFLASKDKDTGEIGPLSEGAKKNMLRFALGMQLISADDLDKPNLKIPFRLLEGRQCCATIKGETRDKERKNETTGKYEKVPGEKTTEYRIPFCEVWPVSDEHVKEWPKDPAALQMAFAGGEGAGTDEYNDLV